MESWTRSAGTERRASPRVRLREVVQYAVEGEPRVGLLLELNLSGGFVNTVRPAPVGVVLPLRLELGRDGLEVQAEVLRANTVVCYDARLPLGMAFRFVDLGDEARRKIVDHLAGAR